MIYVPEMLLARLFTNTVVLVGSAAWIMIVSALLYPSAAIILHDRVWYTERYAYDRFDTESLADRNEASTYPLYIQTEEEQAYSKLCGITIALSYLQP